MHVRSRMWFAALVVTCVAGAALHLAAVAQTPTTDDQAAAAKAEAFVDRLAASDVGAAENMFDQTMKGAMPVDRLGATWAGLTSQFGAFTRRLPSRVVNGGLARVVIVPCQFSRATLDLQIAISPADEISGLFVRPSAAGAPASAPDLPGYADPARYKEQEVVVGSGAWKLPGTLTMPVGAGPFPAIVLVQGSGPADRDETVGPNKPFRDLALGLASRGVAVLRYEKRTREYGPEVARIPDLTVREETIDDAVAAVALVGADARVDRRRIVVLGHSLGGTLIPRIAAATADPAGFVILAGGVRRLDEALLAQVQYLAGLDGSISSDEQQQIDAARRIVTSVQNLRPEDAGGAVTIFGAPASYWLDLRAYDPIAAARAVTRPMLILQGERDYQVTMDDFSSWKAALGARRDVTFKSVPGARSPLHGRIGPSTPQEYERAGHVADEVIADLANWVAHLAPR